METYEIKASDINNNLLKLGQIVFELTTACNFRCEYCIYSGLYEGMQTLSNDFLTFDKAKCLLDYLSNIWEKNNRLNSGPIYVGFYGGEPLLNFPLIKQIVDYIERNWKWHVIFTITTNAYLLDRYMEYIVEKNFLLTISLDGNQTNNKFRRTKSGKETFPKVFANVMKLKEYNEEYFNRKVNFNAVFNANSSYEDLYSFFIRKFNKIPRIAQMNNYKRNENKETLFSSIYKDRNDSFLSSSMKKKLDSDFFYSSPGVQQTSRALFRHSGNVFDSYGDLLLDDKKRKTYPTGTCAPFAKKIFVTAKGEILQCEKVSHEYSLGNIVDGEVLLDFDKIAKFFNKVITPFANQCDKCALRNKCPYCFFQEYPIPSEMGKRCVHFTLASEQERIFKRCLDYLKDTPQLYEKILKQIAYS